MLIVDRTSMVIQSMWNDANVRSVDARTTASARTGTSQNSGAMDSASTSASGRAGLWVVLRLSDVGLVGERGSKVPNASIGELSLEIEVALALTFEYAR